MQSPYDLIQITAYDLEMFKRNSPTCKINILINLILDELPLKLKPHLRFVTPCLKPIHGFEDEKVRGYKIVIRESKKVEKFVHGYIPFFLLRK